MKALKKADIKPPVLPKETVEVPELEGEVIVRGLLLRDRIALFAGADSDNTAQLSKLLAATVIDIDGVQVYTADQWEEFGAKNFDACIRLFNVARRLSGLNAEVAQKN
jgi:hypothetical protein